MVWRPPTYSASERGSTRARRRRVPAGTRKLTAMKSGVWNLGFGLVAVGAGLSGQFALPGTSSPIPLIALGAALATFGVYQLWRARGT